MVLEIKISQINDELKNYANQLLENLKSKKYTHLLLMLLKRSWMNLIGKQTKAWVDKAANFIIDQ